MSLIPGSFCQLHGLIKAPQLNDKYGILIEDQGERWKVHLTHNGQTITVKAVNLRISPDDVAWRVNDNETLVEICRNRPFADRITRKLWTLLSQGALLVPSAPLDVAKVRLQLQRETKHVVFWLHWLSHNILIEKCQGVYRIFRDDTYEACTVANVELLWDTLIELQEWIAQNVEILLKHCKGLQSTLILKLLNHRPDKLEKEEAEVATKVVELSQNWSHEVVEKQKDQLNEVVTETMVTISVHDTVLVEIPRKQYTRVSRMYRELTLQTTVPPVFWMQLINQGVWWEYRRNPDSSAVGFGIRAAPLE